jgi:hypothetical protein
MGQVFRASALVPPGFVAEEMSVERRAKVGHLTG